MLVVVLSLAFLQVQTIKEIISMKKDLNHFDKELFKNEYEPEAQLLLANSTESWKFKNNERGWKS